MVGLALFAGAIVLTAVVEVLAPFPGEPATIKQLQDWAFLGAPLSDAVRAVTSTEVVLLAGAALAGALWLRGARREATTLAVLLVALAVLQPAIKELVDRPRPPASEVDIRGSATSPSFPAGHVMSPTVLYGWLIVRAFSRRPVRPLALLGGAVLAVLLALSGLVSVYLGVHWPSDVLGGYLWGAAIVVLGSGLMRRVRM